MVEKCLRDRNNSNNSSLNTIRNSNPTKSTTIQSFYTKERIQQAGTEHKTSLRHNSGLNTKKQRNNNYYKTTFQNLRYQTLTKKSRGSR